MLPYGPVYVSTGVETNCRALQQHLVVLHALTTTLASFNNFVFLVNYFQTLVVLIYFALHNGPHTNYHVSTGETNSRIFKRYRNAVFNELPFKSSNSEILIRCQDYNIYFWYFTQRQIPLLMRLAEN